MISYRSTLVLMLGLAITGCNQPKPPDSTPKPAAKSGVSIAQSTHPVPPTAPPPDAPVAAATDAAAPVPTGGTSLGAEARKQRNLEWLKILKTGSPQQKQKVQDQLTLLSSEELTEITELYEKQEKLK